MMIYVTILRRLFDNYVVNLTKLPFRQIKDDLMIVIQISSYLTVSVTDLDVWYDDGMTFTWQFCSKLYILIVWRLIDNFVVMLTKLQQFLLPFRQIKDDLMYMWGILRAPHSARDVCGSQGVWVQTKSRRNYRSTNTIPTVHYKRKKPKESPFTGVMWPWKKLHANTWRDCHFITVFSRLV